MIDKHYGAFVLTCDVCGGCHESAFNNFSDALQYAEKNGWKTGWGKGIWENICPECIEEWPND